MFRKMTSLFSSLCRVPCPHLPHGPSYHRDGPLAHDQSHSQHRPRPPSGTLRQSTARLCHHNIDRVWRSIAKTGGGVSGTRRGAERCVSSPGDGWWRTGIISLHHHHDHRRGYLLPFPTSPPPPPPPLPRTPLPFPSPPSPSLSLLLTLLPLSTLFMLTSALQHHHHDHQHHHYHHYRNHHYYHYHRYDFTCGQQ